MKAYIIVTLNLCTMHGANMYIYNKTQYLKEHGYRVFVYSAEQGEIVIPGLREYAPYQSPYLRFYPGCFSKGKIRQLLKKIRSDIGADQYEEIIVESTNLFSALWGELLSEQLKCKHLVFILQESFDYTKSEQEYLRFKFSRHELAGINPFSVRKMLADENLPVDDSAYILAYCNNSIDDCEDQISPRLNSHAALTIGSIGRLEKKYVLPLAAQLREYCQKRPDKVFNIVFVGGTREQKQIHRIEDLFKECRNVNLVLAGVQFPVPRSFADRCDFFISAAGSARATYYYNYPTICLNPGAGDIIGIPGLTCQDDYTIYSSCAPISKLEEYIALLLEKKEEIQFTGSMDDGSYKREMTAEFDRQLRFLDLCSDFRYYDTYKIKFESRSYRPFNVLGKFVHAQLLYDGLVLARKLLK